jgi:hypothetical protein
MRYPASEKLKIIRRVEKSHLPVRRTLDKLGIPSTTFNRWYDRYQAFGKAGLEDRQPGSRRVPAAGWRGDLAKLAGRLLYASPPGQIGIRRHIELTFQPDHSSQAVHFGTA